MEINMKESLFSLKGKSALITGGYRGIGLLFSEVFAEAGADIAIAARSINKCEEAAKKITYMYGNKSIAKALDVADSSMVDRVISELISELGKIDILVNCAGISGSEKSIIDMADSEIEDVMKVDFMGTFFVCRAVAKHMALRREGKIINVSSILGKIASRYMAPYCASKAAVTNFSKVLALEMIRYNVQVNILSPGYFLTDFNKDFFDSERGKVFVKKMIPAGRMGNVSELKTAALFLATCPPFMTGTEIVIDGGHTIV